MHIKEEFRTFHLAVPRPRKLWLRQSGSVSMVAPPIVGLCQLMSVGRREAMLYDFSGYTAEMGCRLSRAQLSSASAMSLIKPCAPMTASLSALCNFS